ncbi:hypothetical protein [Deinococcus aquiradiocola]|uniref:Uncharacterized protein n=1 Tax=Deinococcus aquiradiocola TaxID=393059 RepID=A0A917P6M0_9DEIO|nr:hypothetical protein [Deinococcus aquiradiocola]GGJ63974.1 hypothetical protein GCM10008939_04750 [Deinococcus aquiradiocola]
MLTRHAAPPAPRPLRRARLGLALLALSCGALASAVPAVVATFRAQFDRVDVEGHLLLRVNQTVIPVDLYGVTLKIGADGVLGRMLPSSSSLDVQVVEKGSVPKVILLRGKTNVADDLVRNGYATRP